MKEACGLGVVEQRADSNDGADFILHDHHDGVDVLDYHFKERTVRARSRGMRIACAHLRLSAVRMRP